MNSLEILREWLEHGTPDQRLITPRYCSCVESVDKSETVSAATAKLFCKSWTSKLESVGKI
jgi:hypothetical protein